MLNKECGHFTGMKTIDYETVQQMSPQSFQKILRTKHIIISGYNLPCVSCDRGGLTSLNSLKESVNIEGRVRRSNMTKHFTD